MKGYLLLETGDWFSGTWIGADVEMSGEVVFQTGMTGYQEVITDPSYAGQIVNFTYPLIGNYGINTIDDQSIRPHIQGVIVAELCRQPSHSQYSQTFEEVLQKHHIPGLSGIDTRELTKIIRKHGSLMGTISRTNDPEKIAALRSNKLHDASKIINEKEPIVDQITIKKPHYYSGNGPHVVVIDYGSKFSIIESLRSLGCAVTVVPSYYSAEAIRSIQPDGIVFSNGPGDPKQLKDRLEDIKQLALNYPTLGICLGHQALGLAFGGDTQKLPFGHRGVNHPVINLRTKKVWITSQNHGYIIKENSLKNTDLFVTHRNVNDKSVEGMKHRYLPIQSVQFHPEAHPGPVEAFAIFQDFVDQCTVNKGVIQYV